MNENGISTGDATVVRMKGVEVTYTSPPKLVFKGGVRLDRKSLNVFAGIDLEIRKGEFATIVGPSGCGKSTLFRLILGSQFPTRGEVFVNDSPVKNVTPRTGIVYQRYSLFPHLTVADNIALGPLLQHTGPVESVIREQARENDLTVSFVTHDLDEALFLGSRIIGLSQYWKGDPEEKGIGARIVTDRDLNPVLGEAGSREAGIIDVPDFRALRRRVHQDVLDPEHLQHSKEFDIDPRP